MIKEGTFVGTYFRDIYSGVNDKWYKKSQKEFNDCNWTRTHNHLVHKRTLNHLVKLVK